MGGGLSNEIVEDLFRILDSIVGSKAVSLLKRRIGEKGLTSPVDIAFEISTTLGEIFGEKGAFATLREIGRQVARDLMENHPREEWEQIFQKGLNLLGFAKGVERKGDLACICSCVFYPQYLQREGFEPIKHPVCWMGLGFVEGFMKAFTGAHGVRFKERDCEGNKCWFELVRF